MSTLAGDSYPSYDSKSCSLMINDSDHQYRQRFYNMKLVVKELQEQLALYKNRCSGVDTVALMLKESKMEVLKLTKQCKAFETAVANLQNRLSINGLPSSVNTEEAERFVPGASKQTLDNLAKENARLRSQLKSGENQAGKKSEDFTNSKETFDNLEAENNELKRKIDELENMKLAVIKDYESVIERLSFDNKELHVQLSALMSSPKNSGLENPVAAKKGTDAVCQTNEMQPHVIEEIRKTLKHFSAQCLKLDSDLEDVVLKASFSNSDMQSQRINDERCMELERKLNQVILMNQRWQVHNDNQEQQVHQLGARISELDEINQELEKKCEMEKLELEALRVENARLKREVDGLMHENLQRRQQVPLFDPSIVEILKQQIQVCTEDFNTERKDREVAVNKAKLLQDENNKLTQEVTLLKQRLESYNLSKVTLENAPYRSMAPSYQNQSYQQGSSFRFRARGDNTAQRYPPQLFQASGFSPASSISPVTSPVPMSLSSSNLSVDRSLAPHLQENPFRAESGYASQRTRSEVDFNSLPRSSRSSTPDNQHVSGVSQPSNASNVSMPLVSRNSSSNKPKGEYLSCPKCNMAFSDNQNAELLIHIEKCNA